MSVQVKNVRENPAPGDGLRVLPERQWPPGVRKSSASVDLWLPHLGLAPKLARAASGLTSAELRKRYFLQLRVPDSASALEQLYRAAGRRKNVTLLHARADAAGSAADLLRHLLGGSRKPPTGSGPSAAAAGGRTRAIRRR